MQGTQGHKKEPRERAPASHKKTLVIKVNVYAHLGYLREQLCRDDFAEAAHFVDDLI